MITVKRGSRGDAVKLVQNAVGVNPDGIYGALTEAAVIAFQKAHGLTADGICGPKTWAALGYAGEDAVIKCDDIKQYAAPHGSMVYGPDKTYSTYKSGGCCPTSFAIVLRAYGLAEGESATETVQRAGRYAWQHGYRVKGQGTRCGLLNTCGCKYTATCNASKIESALRAGKLVVLLIKAGFDNGYTGSGHYVVAYGISGDRVLLRDVGSGKARRQYAALSKITRGLKNAYIMDVR